MQVETALFFETVEEIYARLFRQFKPRTPLPAIHVHFKKYANPDSRITLSNGVLRVEISDMLEGAPAPVHEALAGILIGKLYRRRPDANAQAVYRRYLNRADVRRTLHLVKQQRGWKQFRDPKGSVYDLRRIFDDLNVLFFNGMMAEPQLGWSCWPSRTTLGHYDPSHHAIILSSLLDARRAGARCTICDVSRAKCCICATPQFTRTPGGVFTRPRSRQTRNCFRIMRKQKLLQIFVESKRQEG